MSSWSAAVAAAVGYRAKTVAGNNVAGGDGGSGAVRPNQCDRSGGGVASRWCSPNYSTEYDGSLLLLPLLLRLPDAGGGSQSCWGQHVDAKRW